LSLPDAKVMGSNPSTWSTLFILVNYGLSCVWFWVIVGRII
jgi:hypothetical protein